MIREVGGNTPPRKAHPPIRAATTSGGA